MVNTNFVRICQFTGYNRWTQTSNPATSTIANYAVDIVGRQRLGSLAVSNASNTQLQFEDLYKLVCLGSYMEWRNSSMYRQNQKKTM